MVVKSLRVNCFGQSNCFRVWKLRVLNHLEYTTYVLRVQQLRVRKLLVSSNHLDPP